MGFDGNKKIKGRKRHLLVGTLGLIVAVVVTAANVDDRQGLMTLLHRYFADGVTRLRKLWVDGGYLAAWLREWVWGLKQTHKIVLEVVEREGKGFQVVPHRWVVERTFAWLLNYRRPDFLPDRQVHQIRPYRRILTDPLAAKAVGVRAQAKTWWSRGARWGPGHAGNALLFDVTSLRWRAMCQGGTRTLGARCLIARRRVSDSQR